MLKIYDSKILSLILITEPYESDILWFHASAKARSEGQGRVEMHAGQQDGPKPPGRSKLSLLSMDSPMEP